MEGLLGSLEKAEMRRGWVGEGEGRWQQHDGVGG